jgi:pimeloyl-ACP methyl ester carboxylesterase
MPVSQINGVEIHYEVLGSSGPWVALTPGGRLGNDDIRSLAARVAAGGYRVLIHDRRNCGASEVSVAGEGAEHEIWAMDLYVLLQKLDALPAVIGGGSSGCRMSIEFALRYPQAVSGLLLWRITGGAFAVQRLREKYYGEYIRAAQQGGMAAVCETAHFRERIAARPGNKQTLMNMDAAHFIAAMQAWNEQFCTDTNQPVIGASAAQLQSIKAPAFIVPGNDKTHPQRAAAELARLMPDTELRPLMGEDIDIDVDPHEHWDAKEETLAGLLLGGLQRMIR